MRAARTAAPFAVEVGAVDDPGRLQPDDVLVRPELVGICGSDVHLYRGELGTASKGRPLYPRVQGHEFAGIVEDVGSVARGSVAPGQRVAIWPLSACGRCYPCRIGRPNVCDRFSLIGVHRDGGLAELVRVPVAQVVPVDPLPPALASFVEPMSVAVHGVVRARLAKDEIVVVLGGGAIGQAVSIAARARGARVVLVEPRASRREIALELGAEAALDPAALDLMAEIGRRSDGEGAPAVIDTTGSPTAIAAGVALVAGAGRVVVVGISHEEVGVPIAVFTDKECDLLGSNCQDREDIEEAIRLVGAEGERLVRHLGPELPLEATERAFQLASDRPDEALKVLVRISG